MQKLTRFYPTRPTRRARSDTKHQDSSSNSSDKKILSLLKPIVVRKNTAHFERYVSGIFGI